MKQSFPKNEKLKRQKLIERLFQEGRTAKVFPLKAILMEDSSLENTQAAFAVPKKIFKNAVDRNRIKRLMREAYRTNKGSLIDESGKNFAVLFIYLGKEMPTHAHLQKTMVALLKKCH